MAAMAGLRFGVVDHPAFDTHHAPREHPERPERLVAAREGLRWGVGTHTPLLLTAPLASLRDLTAAHAAPYAASIGGPPSSGYGYLDSDTYYSPGTAEAALRAAGGAAELARGLVGGRLDRAIALVRPPGHHARPAGAMGFCLLNNVAVAAGAALAAGTARVAIVDWDVHHGNGTQEIFEEDPRVLFISLHQWPCYPGTGAAHHVGRGAGTGTTVNLALPPGCDAAVYAEAFRRVVLPALRRFAPELILVSAGYDAHSRDPLGAMELDATMFGAMTCALIAAVPSGRVGVFLEGGYDLEAVRESVCETTRALLGAQVDLPPPGALAPDHAAAIARTRAALAEVGVELDGA